VSIIATAVKHLLAAGVTGDALVAAIAEMEEQVRAEPKPRSAGAIRQARYEDRRRQKASEMTETDASDAVGSLSLLPNENKSNPTTHTLPERDTPRTCEARPVSDDCAAVMASWNEMASATSLPACQKLSPARRKACQARLRDDGLAAIQQAIQRVPDSAFLRGETGSWSGANIDFLLRPDTVTKILEGKYDDRPVQPATSTRDAWRGASRVVDNRDGFTRAIDELAFGAGGSPH
jgi:hypothetical protein